MHEPSLSGGFVGAWLPGRRPIYQAVLDLQGEEVERERILVAMHEVGRPPPVSAWWWLLPPVRYLISARRRNAFGRQVAIRLPDTDYDGLTRYVNETMGWLLVGLGGFLIAGKETYDLVEGLEWELWMFWALLAVMTALCLGHAAAHWARDRSVTERRRSLRTGTR